MCSAKPAKVSIWRSNSRFWSALMSSQAGISLGRGVSLASGGITPSFFCRAKVSSRSLSQPPLNWPLYLAIHSLGAWCGACVAPVAKYM